jgi:hypothetical protein
LTRHGFVIVEDKSTPLNCTAEFSAGFTRCTAWICLRRDERPIVKVREMNAWFPWARSAQEARVKVAIEKFDQELSHVQKKLD